MNSAFSPGGVTFTETRVSRPENESTGYFGRNRFPKTVNLLRPAITDESTPEWPSCHGTGPAEAIQSLAPDASSSSTHFPKWGGIGIRNRREKFPKRKECARKQKIKKNKKKFHLTHFFRGNRYKYVNSFNGSILIYLPKKSNGT